MKALVLNRLCSLADTDTPLTLEKWPDPEPAAHEVRLKVLACGVCHTELDEIEGRTPPRLPIIPGHEVVGVVDRIGEHVENLSPGERVGVGWFYSSCGHCRFCRVGDDNLCESYRATGRDAHGGYAELMVVPETSAFPIPDVFDDLEAAPLLCAGAIGYRSFRLSELKNGEILGLTGFGASGHLVLKMVKHVCPDSDIFVFARSEKERQFALKLGAVWAGDTTDASPEKCRAIIDTTPVWKPVVEGMKNLEPGGRLVINAIRKEAVDKDYLMRLDYPEHLWMEKEIKSVANVARRDIGEFLQMAAEIPIRPSIQTFMMEAANEALMTLKHGGIEGAKVLQIER